MPSAVSINGRTTHAVLSARQICRAIKQSDSTIRQNYPLLYHQDCIGAIIFISSLLLILFFSYLYLCKYITAIPAIVLIALPISLLHELEHDIIHNLYFKQSRWVQNVMFSLIWSAKLHISPWYRRQIHLKHHLLSGQPNDAEERLIGLGLSPSFTRMAVSVHPFAGLLVSDDISKDAKYFKVSTMQLFNAPVALLFTTIIRVFLGYNALFLIYCYLNYDFNTIYGIQTVYPIIHNLTICLCFPNLLRQSCLVLMSTSTHYFKDIPLNTVYYQNQILDSWYVFPFQLFCFNFGATHIVHHYVPSQPFYIRHFTARSVKSIMLELGVRNNDFGILWRNNGYTIDPNEDEWQQFCGKIWFAACLFIGFPLYVVWDMITLHKFGKNIIDMISGKSLDQNTKNADNEHTTKHEFIDKEVIELLNASVDQMTLYDVSADQVEELSTKASEAS